MDSEGRPCQKLIGKAAAEGRPTVKALHWLTTPLMLTDLEKALLKCIVRSAQAILPLQGYSLITGHHYLLDRGKQSFKVFLPVEKQVWRTQDVKDWWTEHVDIARDLLWHKAGHPVANIVKEEAAEIEAGEGQLVEGPAGVCGSAAACDGAEC
ncbi:uncharacterized protein LOC127254672 [Andrographis paniculata]|uniref:uncharacterized protein LOC127254672 n=1 Tax=Andrographis paniculata TaxID=175694 RepID=UPI0021E965C4|nr:uncharacterized protein LOC127254672 [Andrographis paniculata]